MSQRKLSNRLRSINNKSISQFIREVRLQKALELLQKEDMTAAEVAYKVGFGSATYFNKCFHELYGIPPGKIGKDEIKEFKPLTGKSDHKKHVPKINNAVTITSFIIFLIIVAGFFVIPNITDPAEKLETSIAVLPFRNDSESDSTTYYIIGVEDAIRNNLQGIKSFSRVLSRTTTERYRGLNLPISRIAKELKVNYVIEGSALKFGNKFQLNIKLIRTHRERVLWSKNFNNEIYQTTDIFSMENEIAQKIAQQLETAITPSEIDLMKPSTGNIGALDAYLKGEYYSRKSTKQDFEIARQYFRIALDKDPGFAVVHCSLAHLYDMSAQLGYLSSAEAEARQKEALISAFELDSTLAEVHLGLAILYSYEWNWEAFESEMLKFFSINPNNARSHARYSHYLITRGRSEEALDHANLALKLDPIEPEMKGFYCHLLLYLNRYDEAVRAGLEGLKTDSTEMLTIFSLALGFHLKGEYNEALKYWKKDYYRMYPDFIHAFDEGYSKGGYFSALNLEADTLAAQSKYSNTNPGDLAILYAVAGNKYKALKYWEIAYKEHDWNMIQIGLPINDLLRDEPRYQYLCRQMGMKILNKGDFKISPEYAGKSIDLKKEELTSSGSGKKITPEEEKMIRKSSNPRITALELTQQADVAINIQPWPDYDEAAADRAEKLYHQALELDSTYSAAYKGLAFLFDFRLRDLTISDSQVLVNYMDSVIIYADLALKYNINMCSAYYVKSGVWFRRGNIDLAIEELNKAVECNPRYWGPYLSLSNFQFEAAKRLEYIQKTALVASMAHYPHLFDLLKILGQTYYYTGFSEKGNYYLLEALKLDGDSASYSDITADILLTTKNEYKPALRHYEKKYQKDSTDAKVLMMLGYINAMAGRYKESLKFYIKYISGRNVNELFKVTLNKYTAEHIIPYVFLKNGLITEAGYYNRKIIEANVKFSYQIWEHQDYSLACAYAFEGDKENSYKFLRKITERECIDMAFINMIKTDPMLNNLRHDKEFIKITGNLEAIYRTEHEKAAKWIRENEKQ